MANDPAILSSGSLKLVTNHPKSTILELFNGKIRQDSSYHENRAEKHALGVLNLHRTE